MQTCTGPFTRLCISSPRPTSFSTHYLLQTKVQSVVHEREQACRPNDGVRGGVGKNRGLRHPFPACLVRCGLRVRVCTCLVRTCNLLCRSLPFFRLGRWPSTPTCSLEPSRKLLSDTRPPFTAPLLPVVCFFFASSWSSRWEADTGARGSGGFRRRRNGRVHRANGGHDWGGVGGVGRDSEEHPSCQASVKTPGQVSVSLLTSRAECLLSCVVPPLETGSPDCVLCCWRCRHR